MRGSVPFTTTVTAGRRPEAAAWLIRMGSAVAQAGEATGAAPSAMRSGAASASMAITRAT